MGNRASAKNLLGQEEEQNIMLVHIHISSGIWSQVSQCLCAKTSTVLHNLYITFVY